MNVDDYTFYYLLGFFIRSNIRNPNENERQEKIVSDLFTGYIIWSLYND